MKAIRLCKIMAGVVVLVVGALVLTTYAAKVEGQRNTNDLSHIVRFEAGGTWLRDGDRITIDEIHGTADSVSAGNLYEIKGTYTLASHDHAQLAAYTTSSDTRPIPTMNTQTMTIDKGDGHFTLYFYMWVDGNPHLSFYPADGGSSFASVYFGTGNTVLKHAKWLDDPTH